MIENLELKLNGELPVTREELFELVNSHGRKHSGIHTHDHLLIQTCNPNECYDLSNLDVSQINDFSNLFRGSIYNGDISKWDVSNCIDMNTMFFKSYFDNDSISNWNVSNVKTMLCMFEDSKFNHSLNFWNLKSISSIEYMFVDAKFDKDISFLNLDKIIENNISAYCVFDGNIPFRKKYNNGIHIPDKTNDLVDWYKENRSIIRDSDLTQNDLLNYFDNFKESNDLNLNKI